jgi:hypothetical protein
MESKVAAPNALDFAFHCSVPFQGDIGPMQNDEKTSFLFNILKDIFPRSPFAVAYNNAQ